MIVNIVCCGHCGRLHADVNFEHISANVYRAVCPLTGGVIWLCLKFKQPVRRPGPSEIKSEK